MHSEDELGLWILTSGVEKLLEPERRLHHDVNPNVTCP